MILSLTKKQRSMIYGVLSDYTETLQERIQNYQNNEWEEEEKATKLELEEIQNLMKKVMKIK